MKPKFYKYFIENDYISEKELIDVFQTQYNDIFHGILKNDQNKIIILLQKQVNLHLQLINKKVDNSLFEKILSKYIEKYLDDKEKVLYAYQIIKKYPNQIIYLEYLNCFIHCTKCKNALHNCGRKFIVFNDFVFCISCKEVYNEFQVHMYCNECKEEYFTKLREIKNEKQAYYFPVGYKKYHCPILGFEEKLKCIKCKNDLYLNINLEKNKNKINEIFCRNCKCIYDVNKLNNICLNCRNNFKSEVKIYNFFPSIKIDLLCVIHSLYNQKNAFSFITANKHCNCNLSKIEKMKHSDGGDLLEGNRFGKKVIICNKCFGLFNLNCFDWICPICKRGFGVKKLNITEYNDKDSIINSAKANRNIKTIFNNHNKNSPFFKKIEKNKHKHNISHNKFYSNNNSVKKNCYKNSSITIKSNKSVSYLPGKNSRNDLNKCPKIDLPEKINTRNIIKKELINNKKNNECITDNTSTFNKTNDDYEQITENNLNQYKSERANINLKNITLDNNDCRNSLYINLNKDKSDKNKDKCTNKFSDIKKTLLFENNTKNRNKINIIRKNFSVTNNLVIKDKKDNNIILTARNMIRNNDVRKKLELIKSSTNINKNITIKTRLSSSKNNEKTINPINKVYTTTNNNLDNKNKNYIKNISRKFIKRYKTNYKNNNININIKIDNSNNNIINISNNYINENKIKKINNNKINKDFIKSGRAQTGNNNKDINKKNITYIETNLNKSEKKKLINSKINNHIHIISNLNNSNNEKKNNYIIKKNIITTENNSNKKKISQSQNNQKKNQKIILENNFQKKNLFSKINTNQGKFHSDDYNIIDLIGEGTYGKIYLVLNPKTKEKYALKQISLKNKNDRNNHKSQFEFLMKLTEENPELNIIKILGIEVKQLDKFNTVLYVLMEAGKSDWEKEVYQRNLKQRYYTEEELMEILISLVSTFSSLQAKGISHRDVKPQNIVYFEKNKNRNKSTYKITDFGEAKINKSKSDKIFLYDNFEKNTSKQTVRGTELYMSPLLFNALRNTGEIDIKYNPYKSDVYSLGLCLLLAASLSYIPLYKIREIKSIDKIKNIIEGYLSPKYSKKFINLILIMLQINEKFRPDFIELNSMIYNQYYCK